MEHLFQKLPNIIGHIGNYEHCAFVGNGRGQFKPTNGAHPVIGEVGRIEFVQEDRVEFQVFGKGGKQDLDLVITELKKVKFVPLIVDS